MKMIFKTLSLLLFFISLSLPLSPLLDEKLAFSEDWKGEPETSGWSLGALTGLGLIDGTAGFNLLGSVSKKMLPHGFIPDINNSVSIEGQFGPSWVSGSTVFYYSVHMRWDFQKDSIWTLYALGGFGGNVVNTSSFAHSEFFPRVGVGAFWRMVPRVWWRGEVSHEFIGVGILFPM